MRSFNVLGFLALAACGSASNSGWGTADTDGGTDDGSILIAPGSLDGSSPTGCVNLQCQQHACTNGGTTSISGSVYDPAGKNSLYGVVVYVPNSPLAPLKTGASCDSCDSLFSGNPIATAITDSSGKFTLSGVPDGANIPVVVQIGKWRKKYTIANVTACQDNPQAGTTLRLPKNHTEGDIPNIAISTGGADSLECLLTRVGLDASEYGGGASGAGRIHIFEGGGGGFGSVPNTVPPGPASSSSLWNSASSLMPYDILLLSCEGDETEGMNQQALFDYAKAGGRVFSSHFHYAWFNSGPFAAENLATWTPGTNSMDNISANIVTTLPNGQPFPKGQALQQWLTHVGALTSGELPIKDAKHNADVSMSNSGSQTWIVADKNADPAGATQYFSFDTPFNTPPAMQCGRVVFSDLHVGAASKDYTSLPVTPSGCGKGDLSAQEKALEFMLFDLSSCLTPNDQPPQPPTPQPN